MPEQTKPEQSAERRHYWLYDQRNTARCGRCGEQRYPVVRPDDFGPPPVPNPRGEMARWKEAVWAGMARIERETREETCS